MINSTLECRRDKSSVSVETLKIKETYAMITRLRD